jgi:hypothetical protein
VCTVTHYLHAASSCVGPGVKGGAVESVAVQAQIATHADDVFVRCLGLVSFSLQLSDKGVRGSKVGTGSVTLIACILGIESSIEDQLSIGASLFLVESKG